VEQLGAGSGTEGLETLSELALELVGLMAGGYAVAPSAFIRRKRCMGFAWPGSPRIGRESFPRPTREGGGGVIGRI
jgi:hypothetical protein